MNEFRSDFDQLTVPTDGITTIYSSLGRQLKFPKHVVSRKLGTNMSKPFKPEEWENVNPIIKAKKHSMGKPVGLKIL